MIVEQTCPRCGASFFEVQPRKPGRPRRWCSAACRRAASGERRVPPINMRGAVAAEVSLDEHVAAVLDSPAACRRVLRQVQEWADAGGLDDAKWSGLGSEVERLRRTGLAPRLAQPWLRRR